MGDMENLAKASETDVMNVLAIVCSEFNVDESRMYLAGHSMGGAGTLHLGRKYANLWAALALMSPALPFDTAKMAQDTSGLPIVVVTGDDDTITKPEPIRDFVEKRQLLADNCVYIEVRHGDHIFICNSPQHISNIFSFCEKHRKSPMPDQSQNNVMVRLLMEAVAQIP